MAETQKPKKNESHEVEAWSFPRDKTKPTKKVVVGVAPDDLGWNSPAEEEVKKEEKT